MACSAGPRVSRAETTPRDRYVISSTELEGSSRANLLDAVRELRPGWFRAAANRSEPVVYVDDRLLGNSASLSRFPLDVVAEVRFLTPTEAQLRFGQANRGNAAILVLLARN